MGPKKPVHRRTDPKKEDDVNADSGQDSPQTQPVDSPPSARAQRHRSASPAEWHHDRQPTQAGATQTSVDSETRGGDFDTQRTRSEEPDRAYGGDGGSCASYGPPFPHPAGYHGPPQGRLWHEWQHYFLQTMFQQQAARMRMCAPQASQCNFRQGGRPPLLNTPPPPLHPLVPHGAYFNAVGQHGPSAYLPAGSHHQATDRNRRTRNVESSARTPMAAGSDPEAAAVSDQCSAGSGSTTAGPQAGHQMTPSSQRQHGHRQPERPARSAKILKKSYASETPQKTPPPASGTSRQHRDRRSQPDRRTARSQEHSRDTSQQATRPDPTLASPGRRHQRDRDGQSKGQTERARRRLPSAGKTSRSTHATLHDFLSASQEELLNISSSPVRKRQGAPKQRPGQFNNQPEADFPEHPGSFPEGGYLDEACSLTPPTLQSGPSHSDVAQPSDHDHDSSQAHAREPSVDEANDSSDEAKYQSLYSEEDTEAGGQAVHTYPPTIYDQSGPYYGDEANYYSTYYEGHEDEECGYVVDEANNPTACVHGGTVAGSPVVYGANYPLFYGYTDTGVSGHAMSGTNSGHAMYGTDYPTACYPGYTEMAGQMVDVSGYQTGHFQEGMEGPGDVSFVDRENDQSYDYQDDLEVQSPVTDKGKERRVRFQKDTKVNDGPLSETNQIQTPQHSGLIFPENIDDFKKCLAEGVYMPQGHWVPHQNLDMYFREEDRRARQNVLKRNEDKAKEEHQDEKQDLESAEVVHEAAKEHFIPNNELEDIPKLTEKRLIAQLAKTISDFSKTQLCKKQNENVSAVYHHSSKEQNKRLHRETGVPSPSAVSVILWLNRPLVFCVGCCSLKNEQSNCYGHLQVSIECRCCKWYWQDSESEKGGHAVPDRVDGSKECTKSKSCLHDVTTGSTDDPTANDEKSDHSNTKRDEPMEQPQENPLADDVYLELSENKGVTFIAETSIECGWDPIHESHVHLSDDTWFTLWNIIVNYRQEHGNTDQEDPRQINAATYRKVSAARSRYQHFREATTQSRPDSPSRQDPEAQLCFADSASSSVDTISAAKTKGVEAKQLTGSPQVESDSGSIHDSLDKSQTGQACANNQEPKQSTLPASEMKRFGEFLEKFQIGQASLSQAQQQQPLTSEAQETSSSFKSFLEKFQHGQTSSSQAPRERGNPNHQVSLVFDKELGQYVGQMHVPEQLQAVEEKGMVYLDWGNVPVATSHQQADDVIHVDYEYDEQLGCWVCEPDLAKRYGGFGCPKCSWESLNGKWKCLYRNQG